ncbi:hypothetical protein WJX72_010657 [[Myrmecia] bisecta]|uniref:Protein transport protein Sec61 subunit beta n=1 Tax=[Myrmecia] bisecta TaxID=41462 RepID=A0AAW1QTQ9_9CHLO
MAKGTAASQATTIVPRGAGPRATTNAPTTAAGLRRRAPSQRSSGGGGGAMTRGGGGGGGFGMNFYTDDSPGLKISPVLVMTMSVAFIAFVTILHVIGKLRGN